MQILTLNDLDFSNKDFWRGFISTSFPTALNEKTDMSLTEFIKENGLADYKWWESFTGYYDGIFDETDGYVDDPQTFICNLTPTNSLKIEFHPGDTVYFMNDKEIACTGPHYHIQIFPFTDLLEYIEVKKDNRLFLLLLPLAYIRKHDTETAIKIIENVLSKLFELFFIEQIVNSIVYGLIER